MTDDEIELFNVVASLVAELRDIPEDLYYDKMLEIQTVVDFEPGIFPKRFLDSLNSSFTSHLAKADHLRVVWDAAMRVPKTMLNRTRVADLKGDELDPKFVLGVDEKTEILRLCASMRTLAWESLVFDQPHKRRILNRIAMMEQEVQQPKGRLDVFLAGVSDVGEVFGKFGNNVKPLFDRMKEARDIVRRSTKEYEQLPPPDEIKQLPPPVAENSGQ